MSFIPLLHYRNKFEIYSTLSQEEFSRHLFDNLRPDLESAYMTDRWCHNCEYTYAGHWFRFIWNGFNRFNGVSSGELKVSKDMGLVAVNVKYRFNEVFLLCLLFSIIPLMDFWGPGEWRLLVVLLIWLVYVANFIISYLRLNKYFKRLVKDTFIDYDKSYKKKLL